jgi:outer membrane protein OmpA-like peptidoglycan-associated protein
MAQARREGSAAGGPAGWIVLLGLIVLALIIAATSKGCGDSQSSSPAAQSPTTTTGTGTGAAAGVEVIEQINNQIAQSGIVFVTGKADLAPASRATLDRIAAILAANAAVKAEVRGHTDSQGDAQKNLDLSQQRAQAVVDYLVQKGIVAARLTAKGLGETVPIADNNTEAGRAQNRRVEFAIAP